MHLVPRKQFSSMKNTAIIGANSTVTSVAPIITTETLLWKATESDDAPCLSYQILCQRAKCTASIRFHLSFANRSAMDGMTYAENAAATTGLRHSLQLNQRLQRSKVAAIKGCSNQRLQQSKVAAIKGCSPSLIRVATRESRNISKINPEPVGTFFNSKRAQ